jgi:hypothetical protein
LKHDDGLFSKKVGNDENNKENDNELETSAIVPRRKQIRHAYTEKILFRLRASIWKKGSSGNNNEIKEKL